MALLFDLDGTLTDPFEGIAASAACALAELGAPPLPAARQRAFIGPPLQESFAALGFDEAQVATAIAAFRSYFADRGMFENRVYDGIPAVLTALAADGHRLAVATSKPTPFAERILRHFGLRDFFDVVSGATLDGSRRHKADIIGAAFGALGCPPAGSVMIGDRSHDVTGARTMGLASLGVTWGYGEPGELEAAGADAVVDSPSELVTAIAAVLRTHEQSGSS
ncbi:MAG TPA: HAD family hydrolase [Mycobacteriales bacterium]